jgi:hypothetical protein
MSATKLLRLMTPALGASAWLLIRDLGELRPELEVANREVVVEKPPLGHSDELAETQVLAGRACQLQRNDRSKSCRGDEALDRRQLLSASRRKRCDHGASPRQVDRHRRGDSSGTAASSRGHHQGTVALADKLARIVWAVWRHERPSTARGGDGHELSRTQSAPSDRT